MKTGDKILHKNGGQGKIIKINNDMITTMPIDSCFYEERTFHISDLISMETTKPKENEPDNK